jgi:arabinogalactan oligomer/maltooligosaccharide transport system substrate-binding protein
MKSSFIGTIIAVVVVIIVVAAVLSYISTHPSTTKPVTTPPVTTPPVTTISYWEAYSPSELSTFNNKILPLFEAQYPNIKVVVTNVALSTSNYETDAAAHKAPNVYYDSSNDEGLLYAGGFILNLRNYISNSSYFNQFTSGTIAAESSGTAMFGLPVNENSILMFYDKADFPNGIANNTNALITQVEAINKTGVWGFAYGMGADYGYRFAAWLPGFGTYIFANKTTGPVTLNNSAMINTLEFWYNLTYIDHLNAPLGSGSGVAGASGLEGSLFESGKAAIIFDGPWDLVPLVKALGSNLGAAPLPQVSSTGNYFAPLIGSEGIAVSSSQASGASAAQINASILFAKFLASPEAELLMYNGTGDLPSDSGALNSLIAQANKGTLLPAFAAAENLTASSFDPVEVGILAQESGHTSPTPSTPQMNYYYSGVADMHTEMGLYYTNKTISAPAVASCVQAFIESNSTNVLASCS